ncbi:DNA-binding transcription repressor [Chytriomyces hyalinus]|nr:DNA-binding transcription repressor [Chytriomyces hyalinus]
MSGNKRRRKSATKQDEREVNEKEANTDTDKKGDVGKAREQSHLEPYLHTLNVSLINAKLPFPLNMNETTAATTSVSSHALKVRNLFHALSVHPLELSIVQAQARALSRRIAVEQSQATLMDVAMCQLAGRDALSLPCLGESQEAVLLKPSDGESLAVSLDSIPLDHFIPCTLVRVDEVYDATDPNWNKAYACALKAADLSIVDSVFESEELEDGWESLAPYTHSPDSELLVQQKKTKKAVAAAKKRRESGSSSSRSTSKRHRYSGANSSDDILPIFVIPERKHRKAPTSRFSMGSEIEHISFEEDEEDQSNNGVGKSAPKRHLYPGDLYREAVEQWERSETMKQLYARKDFLAAGMYSGVLNQASSETSPGRIEKKETTPNGAATSNLSNGTTEQPASYRNHLFKFAMPMYHGETLLDTEEDFQLPFDLFKFVEVVSAGELATKPLLQSIGKRKPAQFTRIKKNIFVDRKPNKLVGEIPVCLCVAPEDGSPGCGSDCLNRLMQFECTPGKCPTGSACSNQAFQKGVSLPGLEICLTNGRGFGIRTTNAIPKNKLVMEYCGEVIDQETCLERMRTVYAHTQHYYFLNYDKGEVIDGCRKGSDARFVNHSCDPNCRIEKWSANGEYHVGIFADKDIEMGSELTYDYKFESFGPMKKCLCGGRKCRGFLGRNNKSNDLLSDIKALKLASYSTLDPTQLQETSSGISVNDSKHVPFAFIRRYTAKSVLSSQAAPSISNNASQLAMVPRQENGLHFRIHVLNGTPFESGVNIAYFRGRTPPETLVALFREAVTHVISTRRNRSQSLPTVPSVDAALMTTPVRNKKSNKFDLFGVPTVAIPATPVQAPSSVTMGAAPSAAKSTEIPTAKSILEPVMVPRPHQHKLPFLARNLLGFSKGKSARDALFARQMIAECQFEVEKEEQELALEDSDDTANTISKARRVQLKKQRRTFLKRNLKKFVNARMVEAATVGSKRLNSQSRRIVKRSTARIRPGMQQVHEMLLQKAAETARDARRQRMRRSRGIDVIMESWVKGEKKASYFDSPEPTKGGAKAMGGAGQKNAATSKPIKKGSARRRSNNGYQLTVEIDVDSHSSNKHSTVQSAAGSEGGGVNSFGVCEKPAGRRMSGRQRGKASVASSGKKVDASMDEKENSN